tara:strand:+ start:383 stop:565 length:183 start_codon:yes stop_codon:yes gene_type:complete
LLITSKEIVAAAPLFRFDGLTFGEEEEEVESGGASMGKSDVVVEVVVGGGSGSGRSGGRW